MHNASTSGLTDRKIAAFRWLFVVSAIWNLSGSIPGLLTPAVMFAQEFGRELSDPVMVSVYRGAWGTSFIYGLGFLLVAKAPLRHAGIVLMGGTGKALFTLNLLVMYLKGWTSSFALVVIAGDVVFVALFVWYFVQLHRSGRKLFW